MAYSLMRRTLLLRLCLTVNPNPIPAAYGIINKSTMIASSFSSDSVDVYFSNEEGKRRLINRLLYRSRQRGFLELDLVLGKWVEKNILSMDEPRVRALVDVLGMENPDLWKWLTGQEQPPESVNANPVFTAIHAKVMDNLKNANPETRSSPGQPWVRGWDDKRGLDGPVLGNQ